MNNEAFAGFLINKTIQQFPLRQQEGNFNEFRDRNIIMYLQKKFGDLKKRTGKNLTQDAYSSTLLQVKPKAQDKQREIDADYTLDKQVLEIMQKVVDKDLLENLLHQDEIVKKKPKNWRKKPVSINQQLSLFMNDNIDQANLQSLYKNYERQNFKATLNELRTQLDNPQEFKNKFNQKGLTIVTFDDQEQVNFFMNKLCEEEHIDACKVLEVENNDFIKFKKETADEMEQWKNIVQKRTTQEQMQEIMRQEERKQNNQLVQIFKETRIDQFDPDFFKNKVKMTTMKRVNEAQDEKFQKFFTSSDVKKVSINKEDFYRKKNQYSSQKLKTRIDTASTNRYSTTTRPMTSCSRKNKYRGELEFNNLIQKCDTVERQFQSENNRLGGKLNQLELMVDKVEMYVEMDKPAFEIEPNRQFEQFKRERQFKKKFVNYVIDRVEKPSDLLSQKMISENSKKMVAQVLDDED